MANEQDLLSRITVDPKVLAGKPIVRGLRISVEQVVKQLAAGISQQQMLENYPELKADDIRACLLYVSKILENEKVYKVA